MKTLKKNFPKTVLILLLIAVMLNSCSSDDDNATEETALTNYYFIAKIDGVDFSADDSSLVSFGADQTGFFNIIGIKPNGDQMAITLISPTATGTFQVSNANISTAPRITFSIGSSGSNWSTNVTGEEGIGTITVIENNATYMEGTFSFTGINPLDNTTKIFTEGTFKAKKL